MTKDMIPAADCPEREAIAESFFRTKRGLPLCSRGVEPASPISLRLIDAAVSGTDLSPIPDTE
ncbi:hypothetical protein WMW72_27050 [Paenibacillus filicis]|uniref:Transcriptional regulator n=1 Tax=Paenibacillus filicis TaxID=669464 RepID=A0ABU9DRS4_9BACL